METNFYSLPLVCGSCNAKLEVVSIGISAMWTMAVNFKCPRCNHKGGAEFELAELVKAAQDNEAFTIQ